MSQAKGSARGLPIAAHLALMLALAFAAAFVVSLAVIIWLPPRPPDVMRGDQVMERFVRGYDEAVRTGHAPANDTLEWRVSESQPLRANSHTGHLLQLQLAGQLRVSPERVRVAADSVRSDLTVFRVRDVTRGIEIRNLEVVHGMRAVTMVSPHGVTVTTVVDDGDEKPGAQTPSPAPSPTPPRSVDVPSSMTLEELADAARHAAHSVQPAPPEPPEPALFAPAPPGAVLLSGFEIGAQLPSGRWLVMNQGRNWEAIGWIGRAALIVGATLLALAGLALMFARRLAQPIQGFAHAVQAVGVDPQSAPVDERGPREMRRAARAVNAMQARLRSLIADRTKTLATVAHDMRTPLMRLRLAAENADPVLREKLAKEIAEVEALVASFISFARDDPAEEARVRLDLAALLQSLADDQAALGRQVSYEGPERLILTSQSLGLKRLFSNLIDNAVKYGAVARVRLSQEEGHALVDVSDDGPGVPADQRESVFKPFVRLTAAAGGAGLGLPAARSIARAHGGDIAILDSDHGALFRTTLPL